MLGGFPRPVYLQDGHAMPRRYQLCKCGGLQRIFWHLPLANAETLRHRLWKHGLFGKHPVGGHLQRGGFLRGEHH